MCVLWVCVNACACPLVCLPGGSLIQPPDECVSMQTLNTLGAAHQSSVKSVFVTHELSLSLPLPLPVTGICMHSHDVNLIWNRAPQGNVLSIQEVGRVRWRAQTVNSWVLLVEYVNDVEVW